MRNLIKWALVIVACLLMLNNQGIAGGGNRAGTSAAPELLIPVGAQGIALGGTNLATMRGIEAVYWNPAGLARSTNNFDVIYSHMSYIADIGVDYFAVGTSFKGFGSIGFTIKTLSIGDIPITTESAPDGTGGKFNPTYLTIGLTFAKNLSDRTSVGATMNLISETIDRVSASGIAFNIGVQYHQVGGIDGLSFGVVVKNFGPAMKFDGSGLLRSAGATGSSRPDAFYKIDSQADELPSEFQMGLTYAYKIDDMNLVNASGSFTNSNFSNDLYHVGAEYSYNKMLFGRIGWAAEGTSGLVQSAFGNGITFGAGVNFKVQNNPISVDYAYRQANYFDANHIFSVRLGF